MQYSPLYSGSMTKPQNLPVPRRIAVRPSPNGITPIPEIRRPVSVPPPAAVPSTPDPLFFTPPTNAEAPKPLSGLIDDNGDGYVPLSTAPKPAPVVAEYPRQPPSPAVKRDGLFARAGNRMRQRRKGRRERRSTFKERWDRATAGETLDPFRRYPGLVGNPVPQQEVALPTVRDFLREMRLRRRYL